MDVKPGCEPVVEELCRWTGGLMAADVDILKDILAPDFQFTAGPGMPGGHMDKPRFIEMDRKIRNCSIRLLGIVARRMDNVVPMLCHAQVEEDFVGDLGPDMPGASELSARMKSARLCYASAWRQSDL